MEARVIVVCLFFAAIVSGEQAPTGLCRANERLLMCGCPQTCRDPAPYCKGVCRMGCFCEEGQVRNDEGLCVELADCPPILSAYKQDTTEPRPNGGKCPDNEEYRFCEPCTKTCDNPNPRLCPAQCSRGCFCRDGLLRDKNGTCVKPDECSKLLPPLNATLYEMTCGEHQVYKPCETREKTCNKPNPRVPSPCVMGCFCEEGYVKSSNGQCIKLEECPKALVNTGLAQIQEVLIGSIFHAYQPAHRDPLVQECGPDEEYFFCKLCEPSCFNPFAVCPSKVCVKGCMCRPPLLRHHSGRCVNANECNPEKCEDSTEEYVCLFGCELRCDERKCMRPRYCVFSCHCISGLLRDSTGLCVERSRCSNSTEIKDTAVDLNSKLDTLIDLPLV